MKVPNVDKPRYRTRKGSISTNTLAVCDRNLRFVYVLPGWEGSAGDSRILRDAIIRVHGLKVPKGFDHSFILVFTFKLMKVLFSVAKLSKDLFYSFYSNNVFLPCLSLRKLLFV